MQQCNNFLEIAYFCPQILYNVLLEYSQSHLNYFYGLKRLLDFLLAFIKGFFNQVLKFYQDILYKFLLFSSKKRYLVRIIYIISISISISIILCNIFFNFEFVFAFKFISGLKPYYFIFDSLTVTT
jgi:hypothetical protein